MLRKKRVVSHVAVLLTMAAAMGWLQATPAEAQLQTLPTRHLHEAVLDGRAVPVGRLPGSQQLRLAIQLPLRDQQGLSDFLASLYDPNSPDYRHFLSVAQFRERFGPTIQDYQSVISFLQVNGLTVTGTPRNRMLVNVIGSVAAIERIFHLNLMVYKHPTENRTFYEPDREPTVDLQTPLFHIAGLDNYSIPKSMLRHADPGRRNTVKSNAAAAYPSGSGPGGQYLTSDFRTAYYGSGPLNGAGQAIALFEFAWYNFSDVQLYFNSSSLALNVPVTNVNADGTYNWSCGSECSGDGESANDIIQAIGMAPWAGAAIVYGGGYDVDMFNQYAADNLAKQMSCSYGWEPADPSSDDPIFEEMVAQGQNVFVASGDSGAFNANNIVWYPTDDDYIVAVGGTTLLTNGAGGAWLAEYGWGTLPSSTGVNEACGGGGSSGGSDDPNNGGNGILIPSYQQLSGVINSSNGGSTIYRNMPDAAAHADCSSMWVQDGSYGGGLGGTSLSAPKWAGYMALANQQAAANAGSSGNPAIGFLNPLIYALGTGSNYDTDFHDITVGTNPNGSTSYNAVTGYDLVTGWGSMNGANLINALAPTTSNANFALSATPSTLTFSPGGGGTSKIALSPLQGFNAATNLTVTIPGAPSNAPAGLTTSLGASTIPAGGNPVILTVSTTSATPGGTYVIGITGTSGGLSQTAFVTLALPFFQLGGTYVNGLSVNQGGTANTTMAVIGENGFNNSVTYAASNLPAGVNLSFAPVNSTTTTVTATATSAAQLTGSGSPAAITITGSSPGTPSQIEVLSLYVNPPNTGGSGTQVNLSSAFNIYGIYDDADASSINSSNGDGSLDTAGYVYSANILGPGLNFNGTQFSFGPPNQPNAVSGCFPVSSTCPVTTAGAPISLPQGTYTSLEMLGGGVLGNWPDEPVSVTYTDGSVSQYWQSFSGWCCSGPAGYANESVAVANPYADSSTGPSLIGTVDLYGYSLPLNTTKAVQDLTLPNDRHVVVLAATLAGPVANYSLSAGTANPVLISPGSSSMATVTITSAEGYTGTVTLSCSITPVVTGATAPTCSFGGTSPVTVGSSGGSATLTFTTVGSSGAQPALFLPMSGLALISAVFSLGSRNKKRLRFLLLGVVLAGLVVIPACGGGSSQSSTGGGTPEGIYTITVTGTDANGATQTGIPASVAVAVN